MLCLRLLKIRDFPGGPVVKNPPYKAGDLGPIPRQGTKIPHAAGQLSPHTTTTELLHLSQSPHAANDRAHVLWNPRATTREKKTCMPQLERSPRDATKSPCHNEEPVPQRKIPHASTKIPHASTKIPRATTKTRCSQKFLKIK